MIFQYEGIMVGTYWRHTNGNIYCVVDLTNCEGDDPEKKKKYPPRVTYEGKNHKRWSRDVSDWARSMTEVEDPKDV